MTERKIYALFTAINQYAKITKLYGCINDANYLMGYLQGAADAQNTELDSKTILATEATKENIAKNFIDHLGQATENDICLFFFSGHGGQEQAHPALQKHEPDRKLEVIACYDSDLKDQGSFLADKELRYLINQLDERTNANIITIFDCCHSGGNTKGEMIIKRFRDDERLMDDASGRDWNDFIFSDTISEESVNEAAALEQVLPQGNHIHLAACEDKQSAFEVGERGIFTTNLVDLLRQTKGDISYRDLTNILKLKIQGSYRQTPQIYARGDHRQIFQSFLGGITQHQKRMANVVYNSASENWILDMGAIHGVGQNDDKLKIDLVDNDGNSISEARIATVSPDSSRIEADEGDPLDESLAYRANVSGFIEMPLYISLSGHEDGMKAIRAFYNDSSAAADSIRITDSPAKADYLVKAMDQGYEIRFPENDLAVVRRVDGYDEDGVTQLLKYLQHIAQWRFLKNLDNPDATITTNPPLDIHIFEVGADGTENEVLNENDRLSINPNSVPERDSDESPKGEIRIKIRNRSESSFYCALLYLSQDFGVYDLIEGSTIELNPDEEVWARGATRIPFRQEAFIKNYNWEGETHYLKLLVSSDTFDVTQLTKDRLPHPDESLDVSKKGLAVSERSGVSATNWTSQLVELRIPNPYFKNPNEKHAKA